MTIPEALAYVSQEIGEAIDSLEEDQPEYAEKVSEAWDILVKALQEKK